MCRIVPGGKTACQGDGKIEWCPSAVATGTVPYRCRHRGRRCAQPSRSASGLERAAPLGLCLPGRGRRAPGGIQRQLVQSADRGSSPSTAEAAPRELADQPRTLLDLYSRARTTTELIFGLTASIRWRNALTTSTDETRRSRMTSAMPTAPRSQISSTARSLGTRPAACWRYHSTNGTPRSGEWT